MYLLEPLLTSYFFELPRSQHNETPGFNPARRRRWLSVRRTEEKIKQKQ